MDAMIRSARHDDEHDLRRIDHATWSTDTTPAPVPVSSDRFFDRGREPDDTLVAEQGSRVVGYVLLGAGYPMPAHAHVAFVRGLAVDPVVQGRGIGRLLLEAALSACARRGIRKVRSNVLATNPASIALHRAVGFEVEATLRGEFMIDGAAVDDLLLAFTWDEPPHPAHPD